MSSSGVKLMIARLKDMGIVETNGAGGSRIVSEPPQKTWIQEAKKELAKVNDLRILLNRIDFEDSRTQSIGFAKFLNNQKELYKSLQPNLSRPSAINGLLDVCAELVTESTGTSFGKEEVELVPHRNTLIFSICRKFMSLRGKWVMPRGSLQEIRAKIRDAKRDVEFVLSDDKGINVEDLDRLCKKFNVQILYLDLTSPVRPDYFAAPERIERMLLLQKQHGFRIVIEYNYPDKGLSTRFLKEFFPCSKDFLLLVRSFSIYDQELQRLKIVASSKKTIRELQRAFVTSGAEIAPELGFAMLDMCAGGQLGKKELKVEEIMTSSKNEVVNELLTDGKWKSRGIRFSNGYAIYLEPLKGLFRENAIALLADEKIDVVDSAAYDLPPNFKKGIIIGIGKYAEKTENLNIIKTLNKCADKLIIGSED
ncbi:MAG: hypothetical protein ABWY16_20005 [Pedobacter sp.]|uniref:hypothetical protein n=1 Tax=Pedobacter sp. TaxID=1411316 RepID=UPI0033931171